MIKKILKISLFFLILGMFILPSFVSAEECTEGEYKLERPILGFGCAKGPADYIVGIYPYALGFGVFAAALMIVYAGVAYSLARDDVNKKTENKKKIYAALGGLGLILGVILGLNIINPDLADPKKWQEGISIKEVPKVEGDITAKCPNQEKAVQACVKKCQEKGGGIFCLIKFQGKWRGDCATLQEALEECEKS